MLEDQPAQVAQKFAADFIKQLDLATEAPQRCEWSCLLWSNDHWAAEATKAAITLQQAKERLANSSNSSKQLETLFVNSQFLNTVAQVDARLFEGAKQVCKVKNFPQCPYMAQRQELLTKGSLANAFVTVLQKATFYAMLDRHPIDSGLLNEEYTDVYGIDLTNFRDLEDSLRDGRFEKLYAVVVKRARQFAGLPPTGKWTPER